MADGLGAPIIDVPLRLVRGIRQVAGGAPFEAIQNPQAWEEANRTGEVAKRYEPQINAIRQAAASGAPESVPAAWNMLAAFRTRALQDNVPAADFDKVFEGLRNEVATATRAQLGLEDPRGLTRQALLEGEPAKNLVTPLSNVIANQAKADLSKARTRRVNELLPGELEANRALTGQRNASAGASGAREGLYKAQTTQLVPAQAENQKAQAAKAGRYQPPGQSQVTKLGWNDYLREYNALEKDLTEAQKLKNIPRPEPEMLQQATAARVQRLNELAAQLKAGGGYNLSPVETRIETDAQGRRRVIVAPKQQDEAAPGQRAQLWGATEGAGAAAAAPDQGGGLPQGLGVPQPPPEMPGVQNQPPPAELPETQQMQGPGNVTDMTNLLGPELVQALSQGQNVPKSAVRRQLQQRGVSDPSQQEALLQQLMQLFGGNANPGR